MSFAEQIALEAYDCSSSESESESDDEEEYDQTDQGQAKMGHGVHMPAVPSQPPPPPPAPPPKHVTPSRPKPKDDSDVEHHGQTVKTLSWQQTRAAVATLDSNHSMGAIRAAIVSTGLPVSPGTGGLAKRTKVHIVAEMRAMVGLSPMHAPVEMGIAVEATPPPPLHS